MKRKIFSFLLLPIIILSLIPFFSFPLVYANGSGVQTPLKILLIYDLDYGTPNHQLLYWLQFYGFSVTEHDTNASEPTWYNYDVVVESQLHTLLTMDNNYMINLNASIYTNGTGLVCFSRALEDPVVYEWFDITQTVGTGSFIDHNETITTLNHLVTYGQDNWYSQIGESITTVNITSACLGSLSTPLIEIQNDSDGTQSPTWVGAVASSFGGGKTFWFNYVYPMQHFYIEYRAFFWRSILYCSNKEPLPFITSLPHDTIKIDDFGRNLQIGYGESVQIEQIETLIEWYNTYNATNYPFINTGESTGNVTNYPDFIEVLNDFENLNEGGVFPHGHTHVDHRLPYATVNVLIQDLQEEFVLAGLNNKTIFGPPYNYYNKTTLQALENNDFKFVYGTSGKANTYCYVLFNLTDQGIITLFTQIVQQATAGLPDIFNKLYYAIQENLYLGGYTPSYHAGETFNYSKDAYEQILQSFNPTHFVSPSEYATNINHTLTATYQNYSYTSNSVTINVTDIYGNIMVSSLLPITKNVASVTIDGNPWYSYDVKTWYENKVCYVIVPSNKTTAEVTINYGIDLENPRVTSFKMANLTATSWDSTLRIMNLTFTGISGKFGMVKVDTQRYGKPISTSGVENWWWDSTNNIATLNVTFTSDVEPSLVFSMINNTSVTIDNLEGCGAWVFIEKEYYEFTGKYYDSEGVNNIDTVKIAFSDGSHWINASYNNVNDEFSLDTGSNYVILKEGTVTTSTNQLTVTFEIYFKNSIFDKIDIDIYMYCINLDESFDGWEIKETDYFSIYNLGGYKTLITSGDSGQTTGGDWVELYADANGWSLSNITFRKLQHFRTVLSINIGADPDTNVNLNETGYFALGVDYCQEDWINGWYVNITNYDSDVGGTWAGSTWTSWICLNCSWYNRGTFVKSDNVTVYWEGKDDGINQFRIQVDFWFNRVNSSTTIGGRVAPLYFGVMGSNNFFGSTKVKPAYADTGHLGTVTNMTQDSYFFEDLMNENNEVFSCRELTLMRPWFKLGRNSDNAGVEYEILEAKEMDFIMAEGTMTGINTPQFEEPKMYDFPQRGLLAWLSGSFQGWISQLQHSLGGQAMLGLWSTFVGFLDTVFTFTGTPNAFSTLLSYVSQFFTWMITSFGYLITILGEGFSFLGTVMSKFITLFSNVINGGISIFSAFSNILDGVYTSGLRLWDDYFVSFLPLFPVAMLIYLLWRFDEGGFEAITNDLTFALNVGSFLIHGFISIIQLFLSLIGRIIESIPVVE